MCATQVACARMVYSLSSSSSSSLSLLPRCGAGAPVDWFIVIKKVGSSGGYVYMDNRSGGFVNSRNSMASNSSGAVARTINAAMTGSYVFFNAHSPPGGTWPPQAVHDTRPLVLMLKLPSATTIAMPVARTGTYEPCPVPTNAAPCCVPPLLAVCVPRRSPPTRQHLLPLRGHHRAGHGRHRHVHAPL